MAYRNPFPGLSDRSGPYRMQGSALIVALVMLLLISLLAVGSMQDTILQERMTTNMDDRAIAFEGAEASLRAGERFIDAPANVDFYGNGRMDDIDDWDDHTTTSINAADARAASDPEYHIGPSRCPELQGAELEPCPVEMFNVTAQGVGGRAQTEVYLRTSYGRLQ